ncbi:Dyp-type peroxidase [Usitatibacter palustris]|uniref:Dyp-type peroxidase n=1 Tax=Usitatibacter palustris TaxID=2732487 RepID=UPI001487A868|nr:hypothetical protein [Usitatibacter palustris]
MNTVLTTVAVPFPAFRTEAEGPTSVVDKLDGILDRLGDPKGKPFEDAATALRGCGIHFLSIVAVPPEAGKTRAHLVIEVTADAPLKGVLTRVATAIPAPLREVIEAAGVPIDGPLECFLERHECSVNLQLFAGTAGLHFSGTPGMRRDRIKLEADLAAKIQEVLGNLPAPPDSALSRLYKVRGEIFKDPYLKWAFVSERMPLRGAYRTVPWIELLPIFFRDFAWIWVPLPILTMIIGWSLRGFLWAFTCTLLVVFWEAFAAGLIIWFGYWRLRKQEKEDLPVDEEPSEPLMREVLARENRPEYAQNHLAGVSTLKGKWFRYVTLRIGLWLIAESGPRGSPPGFIDKIGNIHSARWLQLPGTQQLLFLSNYGGNWQGYLEDFIARLRDGLSSVWSNTLNFPRTTLLTQGGAEDGARFKRWARRQQIPTRFWFSAHPTLTTDAIRRNAEIRHGFASATNEEQAAKWLSLFGFAARDTLESREIPTLAFGGMKNMLHAQALMLSFAAREKAMKWLRDIEPRLTYGESTPEKKALLVGLTAPGLAKLGVGPDALATFPVAFQQGMSAVGRARALHDEPDKWTWGKRPEDTDAILLVYGKTEGELKDALTEENKALDDAGIKSRPIRLDPLTDPVKEPFGFRDGISQPIMRGSKRWSRTATDSIHTVEPGELVLGYPDNFLNIAPTPQAHGRDVGRNSTYLVVREFEQHVTKLDDYLKARAKEYHTKPGVPGDTEADVKDWLHAKMVGRWKDGTSLIRHPDKPGRLPPEEALRRSAAAASTPEPATPDPATEPPPAPASASAPATAPAPSPRPALALAPGPIKDTVNPDNAFLYGREDPDGLRCPLGAHIRRANPRDSLEPGSQVQIKLSNRHRVMRVGRNLPKQSNGNAGLLFMCVNADIERQFEFLQQAWLHGSTFHGLDESDPLLGRGSQTKVPLTMTIPTPHGPLRMDGLESFVTVKGGAYFFLPGRTAISVLAWGPAGRPLNPSTPEDGARRGYA